MPEPEDVQHKRFPVSVNDVLYNDGDVSLAISIWDGGNPAIGVRWNYKHLNHKTKQGYPNYGKSPTWFILPDPVAIATLRGLIQMEFNGKDSDKLQSALEKLESLTKPAS